MQEYFSFFLFFHVFHKQLCKMKIACIPLFYLKYASCIKKKYILSPNDILCYVLTILRVIIKNSAGKLLSGSTGGVCNSQKL